MALFKAAREANPKVSEIAATFKEAWKAKPKASEVATSVAAIVATLMYWDTQYGVSAKDTNNHRKAMQKIHRNAAEQTQGYRKEKLKKQNEILKNQDEILKNQNEILKNQNEILKNSSKWFWQR